MRARALNRARKQGLTRRTTYEYLFMGALVLCVLYVIKKQVTFDWTHVQPEPTLPLPELDAKLRDEKLERQLLTHVTTALLPDEIPVLVSTESLAQMKKAGKKDISELVPPEKLEYHRTRPKEKIDSFERYIKLHNDILQGTNNVTRKFVYLSPSGQMCNRLRNLLSGLVIGILTDRAVVSSFKYHAALSDLFDSPLVMDIEKIPQEASRLVRGSHKRILPTCGGSGLTCDDFNEWESDVVSLRGACHVTRMIIENKRMQKLFHERIGSYEGSLRRLFEHFLPPHPAVNAMLEESLQQDFNGHYVVGLHMRSGGDHTERLTDEDLERYFRCAEAITPDILTDKVRFYVAADTQETLDRVVKLRGNRSDLTFHGGFIPANTVNGVREALRDLLLLQHTHYRVLSPFSSYSELAGSWAPSPLNNVYTVHNSWRHRIISYPRKVELRDEAWCWRGASTEPSVAEAYELLETYGCAEGKSVLETGEDLEWLKTGKALI